MAAAGPETQERGRTMFAYLDGQRLRVLTDATLPLVYVTLPASGTEVSLNEARDLVGPLAVRHSSSDVPAAELPVERDVLDGVAVYRVGTPEGELVFRAQDVPLTGQSAENLVQGSRPCS